MVWKELTAHLEVVWAALTALAIVLVLTPAVGSAARHLQLVSRRPEGERDRSPVPRLAFLPLDHELRGVLLGAAVATAVGAVDDFRGLSWWQKLAGQVTAAAI